MQKYCNKKLTTTSSSNTINTVELHRVDSDIIFKSHKYCETTQNGLHPTSTGYLPWNTNFYIIFECHNYYVTMIPRTTTSNLNTKSHGILCIKPLIPTTRPQRHSETTLPHKHCSSTFHLKTLIQVTKYL